MEARTGVLFMCLLAAAGVTGRRAAKSASEPDWLISKISTKATFNVTGDTAVLSNGLISRTFLLSPGFGTVDYRSTSSHARGRSIIRTIGPEAFVVLDGIQYSVGGLVANTNTRAYLNQTDISYSLDASAFQFTKYLTSHPKAPFHWEPGLRHSPSNAKWPPVGLHVAFTFKAPSSVALPQHSMITVVVNYEMYEGAPILAKWVTVEYAHDTVVVVNNIIVEYLSTQKPYSPESNLPYPRPWDHSCAGHDTSSWLYVEATEPHGPMVSWEVDPEISKTPGADEPQLKCSYSTGLGVLLGKEAGGLGGVSNPITLTQVESFRVLELVTDSSELERVGLSRRRMTRLLTPQTQESPMFFHGTNTSVAGVQAAVDQMEEVGFDMFIYSFGSSFNMENTDPAYIAEIAEVVKYANAKGIEVGGYDLICLARGNGSYGGNVGYQWDIMEPDTYKLGPNACFASGWYEKIHEIVLNFFNKTGMSMIETDGPYGGSSCASTNHDHHTGLEDSIYWQNRLQGTFYKDLKELNIFINQPDWYFHQGGNKVSMGYNEYQYSLPRWEDLAISRQGMFDDTYHYIPTMGWMFLPLVQYHSGGAAAEFDPLSKHLPEYEWALAQYMGYGVAVCYRGPKLYDTKETKALVYKWVSFYNKYRDILTSDIVHVRRPDMQDVDAIIHVNLFITHRGLAMVFNPTDDVKITNLTLPLYYTGISTIAQVFQEGATPGVPYTLDRDFSISIPLIMGPRSITWFLVLSGD